ncbi:MAG: ribosome recycling factor, partial [Planctomycetota bacterium]
RNARRDANKHADALGKGSENPISEDEIKTLHDEIQELLKQYESKIDAGITQKTAEIRDI